MDFRATLKTANLKAATTKYTKDGRDVDTPALLTISIVVEQPSTEIVVLVTSLASEGRDIEVSLAGYQMGFG